MYTYFAYGLKIASVIALDDLATAPWSTDIKTDITMAPGHLDWAPPQPRSDWFNCEVLPDGSAYLSWENVAKFHVSADGSGITYDDTGSTEAALLRQPLMGAVLGYALRCKGYLILHASAVESRLDGYSYLFIGHSGAGKSTSAAAMHTRGHRLMSDDVTALVVDPEGRTPIRVLDGFARCKLWQDSVEAIGGDITHLPTIHSQVNKYDIGTMIERGRERPELGDEGRPLGALFELRIGEKPAIEGIAPTDAIMLLISNCFVTMLDARLGSVAAAREFLQCARIVREGHVEALVRPRDFTVLGDVVDLFERRCEYHSGATVDTAAAAGKTVVAA